MTAGCRRRGRFLLLPPFPFRATAWTRFLSTEFQFPQVSRTFVERVAGKKVMEGRKKLLSGAMDVKCV